MKHTLHIHAQRYNARKKRQAQNHILIDLSCIALSVFLAYLLIKTHALAALLSSTGELELLGTFVAGMFFTSIFTTAPAMAMLGEISLSQPILLTAFVGALGSVAGDLIIFRFVRDRMASDIIELLREEGVLRRARKLFAFKHYRYLTILLGGLILASPLPDELAIALLGFAHMKTRYFAYLSLAFNFFGIIGIGLTARMLAGT
ncbi:hypothetical protein HY417_03105 [Candidatus Kaiserbacteria bacterium]|nr:hypothetical protein [Candidatus Kaiserbacteria bacterium]